MMHLENSNIPMEPLIQITEEEMRQTIAAAEKQALEGIHLDYDPTGEEHAKVEGIKAHYERISLQFMKLFGLPKGFTEWFRFKIPKTIRPAQAVMASVGAALSGATVAFTFYLSDPTAIGPAVRAGLAIAALTWGYVYSPYFSKVMTLSKVVKRDGKGKFVATESRFGKFGSNAARSLFFNACVTAAAFGTDALLSGYRFGISLWNSVIGIFARTTIEDPIRGKRPEIRENGTVKQSQGQWTLRKWLAYDAALSSAYIIPKAMHAYGIAPWADNIYYVLGAIGFGKVIWDERFNIGAWIKRVVYGPTPELCETLLMRRSEAEKLEVLKPALGPTKVR